jgi:hypothetical protein
MSLDKLVALKKQVEAALSAKVAEQRRMLALGLSKLSRFQGGTRSKISFGRGTWKLPPSTAIRRIQLKPGLVAD